MSYEHFEFTGLLRNAVDLPVEHVANKLDLGLSSSDTLGGRRLRATAHAKERHLGQDSE
jgi:hypothetical protein